MTRRVIPLLHAPLLLLLVSGTGGAPVAEAGQAAADPRTIAIRGGTILTVTGGDIPNGTVLIQDGRIAAVGADLTIPADAEIVDATGRFVTPGIIDAHSHIAADSINEGGTTVSSMTGILDVLDPTDINIYRDLAGGLTTANILHGSANPIGGKNAVIKLRWGKARAADLLFEGAMPGIKFALGENPTRPGRPALAQPRPSRYPSSRPGVEFVIRDAFTRAKAYQQAWRDYEARKPADPAALPPRRDLQLEPLVEILEGRRLVHAHCYRADEILMLIRLAEEMGFRIATFQHVLEGYKVAGEIAAHGAGASTFSDWWGYKIEAIDAIPYNAALMVKKGVLVSINSDSAEHARRLTTEAAKTVRWGGLSDAEALALVTINPARQLRIDERVGSLEPGKDADVVIWSAHPLSTYALADRTYIDGVLYYDREAEAGRLTRIAEEKSELREAERKAEPAPTTEEDQAPDARVAGTAGRGAPGRDPAGPDAEPAAAPPAAAAAQAPAAGPERVIAITNATLHPIGSPPIDGGTLLIRGRTIDRVGADVEVPAGAEVIDARGANVLPGWINARSTLGLDEPGAGGYEDTSEILDFNPQLRTIVAYHTDNDAIAVSRANGVTSVAVTPSGGILSGQIPVVNLDGWTWEEAAVREVAGIGFEFPALPSAGDSSPPDRPYRELKRRRDRKLDELSRLLARARAYAATPAERRQTDWVLEALTPVVAGAVPLFVRADREAEIREAVGFADREAVRIVISGGLEADRVADLLSEKAIPVILGPVLTLPTREDVSHAASYQAAATLAAAGVKLAFATGDATNARLVPYHAAMSVAWGLPKERALRALTLDAADILGVSDRLGSLSPGKLANLIIVKGDPLEIRSEISHVFIEGRSVGLANRQLALYERYLARP